MEEERQDNHAGSQNKDKSEWYWVQIADKELNNQGLWNLSLRGKA